MILIRVLAGTVFTQEGVDLSGVDLEIDIVQCHHTGKDFADAAYPARRAWCPASDWTRSGKASLEARMP
ncbi:MAG: hypothetical protein U0075_07795 [Thermomicrobiales bacterium]